LRSAGGALESSNVFERLKSAGWPRSADLATMQKSGESRFAKEVRFARLELVHAGLLNQERAGYWALSDIGWATFLTIDQAKELVRCRRHGVPAFGHRLIELGPTTGPRPTEFTAMISRSLHRASWVYIFRFCNSHIWKIGHAENVFARLADVNRHIPVELTGEAWTLFAKLRLPNSTVAYDMEQRILGYLSKFRTIGERVSCDSEEIGSAWRHCAEGCLSHHW